MKTYTDFLSILTVLLCITGQSLLLGQSWHYSIIESGLEHPTAKTAELNNDGNADLLATDGNSIFWYWQRQSLITKIIIEPGLSGLSGESTIDIVDLDLDGDNDVVVNVVLPGALYWYENDQNGQVWTRHLISDNIAYPLNRFQAHGDLDGDGDIDIVSPAYGPPGQIIIFENLAGGSAWAKKVVGHLNDASWAGVADMNNDGNLEILAANFFAGTIQVLEKDVHGGWVVTTIATLPHCAKVQIADVDHDGDLDLISHSLQNRNLVWVENPGWQVHQIIRKAEAHPGFFCNLDSDGDGDTDLFFNSLNALGWMEFLGPPNQWQYRNIDSSQVNSFQPIELLSHGSGSNNGIVVIAKNPQTGIGELRLYTQITTGIGETENVAGQSWLAENYPDPFNPSTNLRFRIAEAGVTQLTVFDLLGREVITLVNEHLAPGVYTKVWDGKNARGEAMSSGIYLYQLKTAGFLETRKMILTK